MPSVSDVYHTVMVDRDVSAADCGNQTRTVNMRHNQTRMCVFAVVTLNVHGRTHNQTFTRGVRMREVKGRSLRPAPRAEAEKGFWERQAMVSGEHCKLPPGFGVVRSPKAFTSHSV